MATEMSGVSLDIIQVHELKTLSHEMFEQRDVHLKEIRQLKEEALTRTSSNATTLSQMFPADEVAEAREQVATLQVRCTILYVYC